jgi:hypothetical protein
MKKLLLALLVLAGLGCLNEAGAEVFDIKKAKFQWNYPAGEPITHFRFKCATTVDGPHTLITTVDEVLTRVADDPNLRRFPIQTVITQRGDYECFLTALNGGLESDPSNEVFFSTEIGASTPNSFGIVKE